MTTEDKQRWSRYAQGSLFLGAGVLHYAGRDFFDKLVPGYLSKYRKAIDLGTGLLQVFSGVSFFVPSLHRLARWTSLRVLLPSFPEAINRVREPERMKDVGVPPLLTSVRVVVQVLMVVWIWWATKAPTAPTQNG
jgi:uncharacterized membrane protein